MSGRYRGSTLGLFWSLLTPLCMLAVFAVVFGLVFKGKFSDRTVETPVEFGLALFAGMVVFNCFAECLTRAPSLITTTPSYVTRVVFPLDIIPAAAVGSALLHLLISLVPLVLGSLYFRGHLPAQFWQWPFLLVPLLAWCLAVAWFGGALGVFVRDLQQAMATITLVLMYLSAVFYPISKVDEDVYGIPLRAIVSANPLAFLAESSRNLAVWGTPLDWQAWAVHSAIAFTALGLGRLFFQRTRSAFADVI